MRIWKIIRRLRVNELREFLLREYKDLSDKRAGHVEELNVIEGRLTEIDLICEAMGFDFKTSLEERI